MCWQMFCSLFNYYSSFISDSGPYDTGVVFNILNDEFPGYPEDTKFGDILYCQGY